MPYKKCKGTTPSTKGYGCNEPLKYIENNGIKSYQAVYGLCKSNCYPDWLLNTEQGKLKMQKAKISAKKKVEKQERKKWQKKKDEMINWRAKLQTKVQEIARLIDIGQPCLARGYHANLYHGGHVWAKGSNPTMALNLHNLHRQSPQSNTFNNDDGLMRDGLKREYGEDYFEFVQGLKLTPTLHYSNLQYKGFHKIACTISNELKRNGDTFDREERVGVRSYVNKVLGIYQEKYCVYPGIIEIEKIINL